MENTDAVVKTEIRENDENRRSLVRRLSTYPVYSHGLSSYFVIGDKKYPQFKRRGQYPQLEEISLDDSDYGRFFKGEGAGDQFKCRTFGRSLDDGAYSLKLVFNDRRGGIEAGSHTSYTLILPATFKQQDTTEGFPEMISLPIVPVKTFWNTNLGTKVQNKGTWQIS